MASQSGMNLTASTNPLIALQVLIILAKLLGSQRDKISTRVS